MSHSATGHEARRQWPLWALAGTGLVWFLVMLVASSGLRLPSPIDAGLLAERANALFPPLVVLLLMAAFLPAGRRTMEVEEAEERLRAAADHADMLEGQLSRIERLLDACAERVGALRADASERGDGLAATAQALEVAAGTMAVSSTDMGRAAEALRTIIPDMAARAREAEAALGIAGTEARKQLETMEAGLARIASHGADAGREADAMVSRIEQLIARIDQSSAETTKTIASRAYTLDAAVTGVLDRSAESFASIGDTLAAQARSVEQMIASARTELDQFGQEGTRVIGQRLDVLLGAASQLKGQFAEQMQLSDQLSAQAQAGISAIEARLAALRDSQSAAGEALLRQADDTALRFEARLAALADGQRAADQEQQQRFADTVADMETQMAALRARQAETAARLQDEMAATIAGIGERLEALKAQQSHLGGEMAAETGRIAADIEARFDDLRVRQQELASGLAADAAASLDRVEGRFVDLAMKAAESHAATSEQLGRMLQGLSELGQVLESRHESAAGLEGRILGLLPAFEDFVSGSASRLPELERGLERLAGQEREMAGGLDSLADRIESQIALLRDASAAFERDHAAVVDLSRTLAGEFDTARATVQEIHASTEQTAIAAAARMVENVMQVRSSVNATAAEIQTLLQSVVAEAEQALDELANTKAEAAFGAPIRLQIASLEDASLKAADAAGEASERLTTRLVDLMKVIAETEARVDEVDTRMDIRARDTLAARSLRLVDSLNNASVDVARLLAVDVGDSAWKRYLEGDRSLFARATVRLADKDTARKIARHYAHDPEFEAEASRYLDQFEQLIRRVLKDPDGESFALVLLSSDIGKLYVLIAEAIGRPVAKAA